MWSQALDLSLTDVASVGTFLGQATLVVDRPVATSEQHFRAKLFEAATEDSDFDSTSQLTHVGFGASDGIRWTNNLGHVESVNISEPAIVPASVDQKASVALVVAGVRVLTGRRNVVENIGVGGELIPLHGTNVEVATGVGHITEATVNTFSVLLLLTAEDEELPGRNSFDEYRGMVPARHAEQQVDLEPFLGLKGILPHAGVVLDSVPSTVDEQLTVASEQTVATTTVWDLLGHCLELVPSQSFWIEHEDVVEGTSGEADTTVTTLDVDLAFVEDGSHVGARRRCTDG